MRGRSFTTNVQYSTECARLLAHVPGKSASTGTGSRSDGGSGSIKIRQKSRNPEAQHQEGGDSDSKKGQEIYNMMAHHFRFLPVFEL